MIPDRIYLEGFLCYREPQEACFDGRTLWMLAGRNGSGKSALFDAMTLVLFGQHRGGKHNTREMIHHAADHFVLELDFTVDDQPYRARRTLSRQGRSTRQIYARSRESDAEDGVWREIPDTHAERGFSDWINTHIALTYETFTASVLLLQGKADNLLLAPPAQRHRLLCQVIGLEELEHLARRARRRLARAEGAERALGQPVEQIPGLAETELAQLRQDIQAALREHAAQEARVRELTQRLEHARQWQDLTDMARRLEEAVNHDAILINRLTHARSRKDRYLQLDTQLAALTRLADTKARIDTCRQAISDAQPQRDALHIKLKQLDAALQESEQAITALQQQRDEELVRERDLSVQHTELTLACAAARRFAHTRDTLRQLGTSQWQLEQQLEQLRTQRLLLEQKIPADQDLRVAHDAVRIAREKLIRCEALDTQLTEQLQRFESVVTECFCSYCLQPLRESHIQKERHRLTNELRGMQPDLDHTRQELAAAEQRSGSLQRDCNAQIKARDNLDRRAQQITSDLKSKDAVAEELIRQCEQAYRDLPSAYRNKVSVDQTPDWAATHYPAHADLSALADSHRVTERQLAETTDSLRTLHKTIEGRSRQQQRLVADRCDTDKHLRELSHRITNRTDQLKELLPLCESAQAALPSEWRELAADTLLSLVRELNEQRRQLLPTHVADEVENMNSIVQRHHAANAQLDLIRTQLSAIPHDARQAPREMEQSRAEATSAVEQTAGELQRLRSEESSCQQRQKRHADALADLRAAQRERRLWRRLVKLLGRSGLQQDLLKNAEHAIVEYANAILDRLSGGQLYVELKKRSAGRSGSPRVLDLAARTPGSGPEVQDVVFLSGSQKFRVAVALSLAIGQFASGVRRPVQAVIIDEGFGCLDTVNRHVMIQELQNLSNLMKRILLVSHQDEFASAFPDGYRCQLVDGATRLRPFHP